MREYLISKGTPVRNQVALELPLSAGDWRFVDNETSEDIEKNVRHFQGLGFILAFTGLIPVHNGMEFYSNMAARLCALPGVDGSTPTCLRRRAFWQGVDYFGQNRTPGAIELPLSGADWAFINDKNDPPTEEKLERLRCLGFILAKAGFISTGQTESSQQQDQLSALKSGTG
jgi:hypothetical protein